jgi:diaminohydroxyphosphoribosylaminopyrimidine deaminase/5-amino-6-(5-phosphoribosylamino)uracil reductase
MRDPNPRVDGEGARILRDAGVLVIESVCEDEVRRQLGAWVLAHHPDEPRRRAQQLEGAMPRAELLRAMAAVYGVGEAEIDRILG